MFGVLVAKGVAMVMKIARFINFGTNFCLFSAILDICNVILDSSNHWNVLT